MCVVGEKTRVLVCDKTVNVLTRSCYGVGSTDHLATLTDRGLAENDFIGTFTSINKRACYKFCAHTADALAHVINRHAP